MEKTLAIEMQIDLMKRGLMFEHVVFGKEHFLFKGIRHQHMPISQQIAATMQCCNENEKKRAYNERQLQIDHGTFTPLIFFIYESMGRECLKVYSRLSDLLSQKRIYQSQ